MGDRGMNTAKKIREAAVEAMLVFLLLAGCGFLWIYEGLHYGYEIERPATESFQTVVMEGKVQQEFVPEQRYLRGVELIFINLAEDGQGTIQLCILDEEGEEILRSAVSLEEINAGEWFFFPARTRLKPGHVYTLQIEESGCSLTPYLLAAGQEHGPEEDAACYVNGEPFDGRLLVSYGYSPSASRWEKLTITLLLICCCLCLGIFYREQAFFELGKKVKRNPAGKAAAAALLFAQFILSVPDIIYRLENTGLDPSWRYFLNVANSEGLKFGRDVYFTYGPLGYLCYLMKLPDNIAYYWIGVAVWLLVIGLHVYMLFKLYRLYTEERIGLVPLALSFLCYLAGYHAPTRDNYLLYLMVLAVVLWFLGAERVTAIPNILLVLMFFGKFSTFTSGIAFCILFILFEFLFNREKKCLLLCVPALISMPILYLAYCPSLESLVGYVQGIFRLSDGWMLTMQWDQVLTSEEIKWLIAIMISYSVLVIGALWVNYKTSCVLLACSASMFFVYKYATTRHGLSVGIWLFAMLFSAVLLAFDWDCLWKKCRERRKIYFPLSIFIFTAVFVTGALEAHSLHSSAGYVKEHLMQKAYSFTHLNKDCIPQEVIAENQLPAEILELIGSETVTVYPWRNAYGAIYDELNMVYYPSVQNANEFIPWLDSKVADYFISEEAAKFILLTDDNIDDHIQYLDNPLTWEAIKTNYSVKANVDGFCLLEKEASALLPDLTLIDAQVLPITEAITCPEEADYVKIYLELKGTAKIKKFLYHIGVVNMYIECEDGSRLEGRAVVPNLVSGFELKKIPQNLEEMDAVVNQKGGARMSSISFGGMGIQDYKEEIVVEWYQRK